MKPLLALALLLVVFAPIAGQDRKPALGLPELHTIKSATLSPSYSCRSEEDFHTGYANTALFLSTYSHDRNSPDLLFNGACDAKNYFQGNDLSLIADLGRVPLEEVTAHSAFNFKNVHSFDLYSRFTQEAEVKAGHTYAVVINEYEIRGLFVFTVFDYAPNKSVDLLYAVKQYQVMKVQSESPGFDWSTKNHAAGGQEEKAAQIDHAVASQTNH
jgi:hypothetical protein